MVNAAYLLATVVNTSPLPSPNATGGTVNTVLNIVFGLAASIAVLMIVISGFRYIVAHGDPSSTASARNSIFYAVIGLLVTMAAYSIVLLVIKGIS